MYEELIAQLEKEISLQEKMVKLLRELAPLEGIVRMQPYQPGWIIMILPYDLEMFHRNREYLTALGFKWDGNLIVSPHCGNILTAFRRDDLVIQFHISPDEEGSTCRRQVVGYEKEPIYEVTCLQADPIQAST